MLGLAIKGVFVGIVAVAVGMAFGAAAMAVFGGDFSGGLFAPLYGVSGVEGVLSAVVAVVACLVTFTVGTDHLDRVEWMRDDTGASTVGHAAWTFGAVLLAIAVLTVVGRGLAVDTEAFYAGCSRTDAFVELTGRESVSCGVAVGDHGAFVGWEE